MLSYVKKRKSIKRKSIKRKSHSRKSNKRRSNKRKSRDGRTPLKLSRYSKKKLGKMKSIQKMGEYFDRAEKRFYKRR